MHEITLIGPGRIGGAFALAASAVGYSIGSIVYRSRRPAKRLVSVLPGNVPAEPITRLKHIDSDIVLLTVSDDSIVPVAREIASKLAPSCTVFHTSGSISSTAIGFLRESGCSVGSIHPLASVSSPELGPERFRSAYFCVEGDVKAVRLGKALVRDIGGRAFTIDPEKKAVYHAAAVAAAGHVTALFDLALTLMMDAGMDRRRSIAILRPLLAGAAANLQHQDPVDALTGPFARADVSTLQRQLGALQDVASDADLMLYLELASRSLDLAGKRGVNQGRVAQIRQMILLAKRDIGC